MKSIDFNSCPFCYWPDVEKASFLQRRILVYSVMYYEHNESCVSDFYYDSLSKMLIELQNKMDKQEYKQTRYFYVFKDFVGSTGFDLPARLNAKDKEYIFYLADYIHTQWIKKQNGVVKI